MSVTLSQILLPDHTRVQFKKHNTLIPAIILSDTNLVVLKYDCPNSKGEIRVVTAVSVLSKTI